MLLPDSMLACTWTDGRLARENASFRRNPHTKLKIPNKMQVEKVEEVSGSTAGASSAAFHIYRAHRRTELLRLQNIEKQAEEDVSSA